MQPSRTYHSADGPLLLTALILPSAIEQLECVNGRYRGAYSFVVCLSHLTIDNASLWRRSTAVPTPNSRDISNILDPHYFIPIHYVRQTFAYLIPSSCFAVCGHQLSPRRWRGGGINSSYRTAGV